VKNLFILFFVIFFCSPLIGQDYFSKTYFIDDSINHRGKSILSLSEGLIILTGRRCNNFSVDCGDLFYLDSQGTNLWKKTYPWVDFNGLN